MTITKGLATVGGCAVGGALLGGLLGYLIGLWAPGAYAAFFPSPPDHPVDAIQVGIGLGIPQGLILGVVIGLVLTAIVAWYDVQSVKRREDDSSS